jgi:AraC-like DNA-binding protein
MVGAARRSGMAGVDQGMSILSLFAMKRTSAAKPQSEPAFVSAQVSEARRYYLDLKPPKRVGIAVVCGGRERMRADYLVDRAGFPYLCVELVVEGSGSVTLNGKRHRLEPGVVFAYGPGVSHVIRTDPRKPMRKYYVDFVGSEAEKLLAQTPLAKWRPARVTDPQDLIEVFDALDREARGDDQLARDLCATLLRLLLLRIRSRALGGGRGVPRAFATYLQVRTHVEAHHERLRTIEDVARECHVTPMHIARLFRRFARTGAYRFLLRLRMDRAAALLIDEGLLVKEVGNRLGFPDAFTFSRAFKRIHGLPPSGLVASRRE